MPKKDGGKLLGLLFAIGRRLRTEAQKKNGKQSFSMLHFHTLRYVADEKRPSMVEVARYLSVTPPAATLLVDGLVKDGFLKRSLDRKDRRAVRLAITARGKAFLSQTKKMRIATFEGLFSVLSAKERAQLAAILGKIAKGAPRKRA